VITAPIQIWLGFFLIVSGISFGRMGPSFKRNQYTLFFVLLGTLCILLPKSNLYDQSSLNQLPEYYLMNIINDFIPWFFPGILGYYLVLVGAPTYWKIRYPQLISGWITILLSLYLYVEYNSHSSVKEIFLAFSSFIGILISLLCFAILVRYVENSTPLDEPAPELTDEEKELVKRIISKNIGVDEE
jgi:hypothetical protein